MVAPLVGYSQELYDKYAKTVFGRFHLSPARVAEPTWFDLDELRASLTYIDTTIAKKELNTGANSKRIVKNLLAWHPIILGLYEAKLREPLSTYDQTCVL